MVEDLATVFKPLENKIKNISQKLDDIESDITIGSDPEFVILCGDNVESANETLARITGQTINKCDDCEICSNCDSCEFERTTDWNDEDTLKETINEQFNKYINHLLSYIGHTHPFNVYIKPNINLEELKNATFKNMMKNQLSSVDYLSSHKFKLSLYVILNTKGVFINKEYENYVKWFEIESRYVNFDFLNDLNAAEIMFESINEYTNKNKEFIKIRDNEDLKFRIENYNEELMKYAKIEFPNYGHHNVNLYQDKDIWILKRKYSKFEDLYNKYKQLLEEKIDNKNIYKKLKEERIFGIKSTQIYKKYEKFHNEFYGEFFDHMTIIIKNIYKEIETVDEEPQCHYDRSECGTCDCCDGQNRPDFVSEEIEIGCDGDEVTGEFRPKYTYNPIEHFNEVYKLINTLFNMLSEQGVCGRDDLYQIKAGGYNGEKKLGGHIHIGFPKKYNIQSEVITKDLGFYLSYYCGLLLKRIEPYEDIVNRHPYGQFNEYSSKDYGIEWRMPASWLVSPEMCKGSLCLTYVIANEYFKILNTNTYEYEAIEPFIQYINTKFYEQSSEIPNTKKLNLKYYTPTIVKELDTENPGVVEKEILQIILKIKEMELYEKYSTHISIIFEMILNNKKWNTQDNIFKSWISKEKYEKVMLNPIKMLNVIKR